MRGRDLLSTYSADSHNRLFRDTPWSANFSTPYKRPCWASGQRQNCHCNSRDSQIDHFSCSQIHGELEKACAPCANKEMWSKQETLGMCLDMWRHTNSYRNIVSRWAIAVGGGLKSHTKRRLYLAFPFRMLPFSLGKVDGLALPVGFDHEAELRKAVSVVLEIDKSIDLNIDNLRSSRVDRFWSYPDGAKSYISILRKRLYMRPAFQEMVRPLDHSPDYSLETLQD